MMSGTARARTHRIAALKRASNTAGGDLSFAEGIINLLALGIMPPER
jgi:hypothetical protein